VTAEAGATQVAKTMNARDSARTIPRTFLFTFFTSLLPAAPKKSAKTLFSWSWLKSFVQNFVIENIGKSSTIKQGSSSTTSSTSSRLSKSVFERGLVLVPR